MRHEMDSCELPETVKKTVLEKMANSDLQGLLILMADEDLEVADSAADDVFRLLLGTMGAPEEMLTEQPEVNVPGFDVNMN